MFDLIADLVNRRSWLLILAWVGFVTVLHYTAPPWSEVSRDDDVRQFPAGYSSVYGQELLERGFPADVSSSSVVFVIERPDAALRPDDLAYADRLAARMADLARKEPAVGLYKISDRRTPVLGPRLISPVHPDGGQATLVVVELKGTYVSKLARLAVDRLMEEADTLPPRKGSGAASPGRRRWGTTPTRRPTRAWRRPPSPRSCWWWGSCSSSIARRCWP